MLSDTDVLPPNLMFISKELLHIDTEAEVRGGPTSSSRYCPLSTAAQDRNVRHGLNAQHGVSENLLVDPRARTIEVPAHGDSAST